MNPSSPIQPAPNAPEGRVETLASYTPKTFLPGQAILCRNVAPLVSFAYALLQRDVPCLILGRDIGAQLISIVRKMRAGNIEHLLSRLGEWKDREIQRAQADGNDAAAERIVDQHMCLVFFINSLDEDSRSVDDLIAKIELMFTDDSRAASRRVTLASIHKAKGLEFHTVFLLDRDLIPSRFARLPWQRTQERNLLYVAITRAMDTLYYIRSDRWATTDT